MFTENSLKINAMKLRIIAVIERLAKQYYEENPQIVIENEQKKICKTRNKLSLTDAEKTTLEETGLCTLT